MGVVTFAGGLSNSHNNNWVDVKELNPSYHLGETLLSTI